MFASCDLEGSMWIVTWLVDWTWPCSGDAIVDLEA
jgi:hypothetical protein